MIIPALPFCNPVRRSARRRRSEAHRRSASTRNGVKEENPVRVSDAPVTVKKWSCPGGPTHEHCASIPFAACGPDKVYMANLDTWVLDPAVQAKRDRERSYRFLRGSRGYKRRGNTRQEKRQNWLYDHTVKKLPQFLKRKYANAKLSRLSKVYFAKRRHPYGFMNYVKRLGEKPKQPNSIEVGLDVFGQPARIMVLEGYVYKFKRAISIGTTHKGVKGLYL